MNPASTKWPSPPKASSLKATVSVVIPTFNSATYLGEALDSVLAQTYQPLEVILVDDGSEDETPQVATAYPGRVTYVRKQRGGPASARNVGVRVAAGEWIAFQDADDIWMPDLLEKLAKSAAETGADLVCCDYRALIDGSPVGTTNMEHKGLDTRLDVLAPNGVLLDAFGLLLEVGNFVATPGVLVKKEALLQIGLFDEAIYCGEDLDLWFRLSQRWRFAVVAEVLVLRRLHARNMTRDTWVWKAGLLKVYEKLERYAPTLATGTRWRKLLRKGKGALLREQGARYLELGDLLLARKSWAKSFRTTCSPRLAAYWSATFLPRPWMEALRSWKRQTTSTRSRPARSAGRLLDVD
jgi:glycosyltransferase involved in cell wall biosynthesis